MAIQIVDAKLAPNPVIAGKDVKALCQIESSVAIQSVQVFDPRDWVLKMYDDGTNGDEVAGERINT